MYYHRADSVGIGFDRSSSGSNAVDQYFEPVAERFDSRERIDERYLLWFHHVLWGYEMDSGRTLWNELVHRYHAGVDTVRWMQTEWAALEGLDRRRTVRADGDVFRGAGAGGRLVARRVLAVLSDILEPSHSRRL